MKEEEKGIEKKDRKVKVAGIQMVCHQEPERNLEKTLKLIDLASEQGAAIICLQEFFHTPWFPAKADEKNFGLSETVSGNMISVLRDKAKEKKVVIISPIFEKAMDGLYYNTTVVINKGGKILGMYRKNHIPNIAYWEEGYYCSRGDLGFPVFHTDSAVIGIQMCWDNFFPEGTRILALKGAQIIFCPTACAFASQSKWEKVISANAMNNGLFCFRVNRVGKENGLDFYGQSFCVDPEGEFVAGPSGLTDAVVLAQLDLGKIEETRQTWNFFKERRPEIYGEVIGKNWLEALNNMMPLKKARIKGEGHGARC
ncbi:MAG: nitrilase-related carbon-nitrogen hydrolase [bacterium]